MTRCIHFTPEMVLRKMKSMALTRVVLLMLLAIPICGQGVTPSPTPQPSATPPSEPKKSNARPADPPVAAVEPFDKADVKTMASRCVTFDTESGLIEMELYPESAPESVRNFLNLVAI